MFILALEFLPDKDIRSFCSVSQECADAVKTFYIVKHRDLHIDYSWTIVDILVYLHIMKRAFGSQDLEKTDISPGENFTCTSHIGWEWKDGNFKLPENFTVKRRERYEFSGRNPSFVDIFYLQILGSSPHILVLQCMRIVQKHTLLDLFVMLTRYEHGVLLCDIQLERMSHLLPKSSFEPKSLKATWHDFDGVTSTKS